LNLSRDDTGWWVLPCRADRTIPDQFTPKTRVLADREAAIEEAKVLIDGFVRTLTIDKNWPG
jgi:hypothetical protein